jgi:hypothetical protein
MGKIVDITEKLSFDTNPTLMIKGEGYEVNADARTVLEIMGDFNNKSEMDAALSAYEKLFSERDRSRIDALKLPYKDLMIIIKTAISMVTGEDEDQGEQ